MKFSGFSKRVSDAIAGYVLLLPFLIVLVVVVLYPLIQGFYMSFHNWGIFGDPVWVGLENYRQLWTDNNFEVPVAYCLLRPVDDASPSDSRPAPRAGLNYPSGVGHLCEA